MAQNRLKSINPADHPNTQFYYLDLIAHRDVSNAIAEKLKEVHQSPQVLVVKKGECTLEASHMDISPREIIEEIA